MPYTPPHLQLSTSTASLQDGSRTLTISNDPTREPEEGDDNDRLRVVGTLKLRGAHSNKKRSAAKVAWSDGVVDNEGCGRKKSKICCIYHKPRRFEESSDESDSDSDLSDSGCVGHGHGRPGSSAGGVGFSLASSSTARVVNTLSNTESNAYESAQNQRNIS